MKVWSIVYILPSLLHYICSWRLFWTWCFGGWDECGRSAARNHPFRKHQGSIYPSHLRNSPTGVESGLRNGMFRKCVRRAGYCPRPAPAKPAGENIDIRSGGAFTKHFPFRNTAKLTKLQYYTHTYALNAPHSSVTHTLRAHTTKPCNTLQIQPHTHATPITINPKQSIVDTRYGSCICEQNSLILFFSMLKLQGIAESLAGGSRK